jgi:hypothetical protein
MGDVGVIMALNFSGLAFLLSMSLALPCAMAKATSLTNSEEKVLSAVVEGTELIVIKSDGTRVTGHALIGAVIVGDGPSRNRGAFRIEKIENDPDDPDGDILLYSFSEFDPKTEEWKPLCNPDQRGIAAGFPLAGSWDEQGTHLHDDNFSITCTSGAIGKCVRYGYKPWKAGRLLRQRSGSHTGWNSHRHH